MALKKRDRRFKQAKNRFNTPSRKILFRVYKTKIKVFCRTFSKYCIGFLTGVLFCATKTYVMEIGTMQACTIEITHHIFQGL